MNIPVDTFVCVTLLQPIVLEVPHTTIESIMYLTRHLKGKFTCYVGEEIYKEPIFLVEDFRVPGKRPYWWRIGWSDSEGQIKIAPIQINLRQIVSIQTLKTEKG